MKKPYIICHMMTSVDGRIDCAMTSKLAGVDDYYATLAELNAPTTLSGRVTAQTEMSLDGVFSADTHTPVKNDCFSKKADADGYEIVVDTKGTLLWPDDSNSEKPVLIITSRAVSKEYLDYLDERNISWIVSGENRIDLKNAVSVLAEEFGVERMAVVGGPTINTAFLEAGLLDEFSMLIGPGVDGRGVMPSVFDGLELNHDVIPLKLYDVAKFDSGAVWIRYKTL